jgi:thiamine biosynthesis lipoprotein
VIERSRSLDCFGGTVHLMATCQDRRVADTDRLLDACAARLLDVHTVLTRFDPDSELCRLNADPREEVPASPLVRRLARAVSYAGHLSGGLVDATCLTAVERAGYRRSLAAGAPDPAGERSRALRPLWRLVSDDARRHAVRRPAGVRLDSGGLAKGMAADLVAAALQGLPAYAVDCGGDVRVGGTARQPRRVDVRDPFGGNSVHRLMRSSGSVATSGITARSWDGGHHLIDPRTGAPADTGVVQATAVAPTGLEAEVRAKAALLGGPSHLRYGGVMVGADGTVTVVGRSE